MAETTKKDKKEKEVVKEVAKEEKVEKQPEIKIEKKIEEPSLSAEPKDEKEKTGKVFRKKKNIRQITHGRAYIQATYNNTIITLTDLNGNVLSWSSAGQNGFKGPKKSTPYAASVIVKDAVDKASVYGLKNVNAFVKGVGSGREAAVRALNTYGINVISIKDITPIPHNGCRARKPRRI
ncbi:MAG: 30S ribosomal protein S11 [Patescibacteria group bacterium]|nr:30S ribosomal protein S11 [Patescibacteria group bacterium]